MGQTTRGATEQLGERMRSRMRSWIEQLRDSQFVVPALGIALSIGLVVLTNRLDSQGFEHPLAITSSVTGTRTLLATIAGAIITVATLVFSLSAVTMQLAASEYSPRVVQGFLRDRRQQIAFAISIGTFTYALGALATLSPSGAEDTRTDWTATTAVTLAVITAVVIVAFIDHVLRRVRVDDVIRDLVEQTEAAFRPRPERRHAEKDSWDVPDGESDVLRAVRSGFVQRIHIQEIVDALPQGAIARLDVWTGHFVTAGRRVVTVWSAEDIDAGTVLEPILIGEQRTIEHDPGFGLRQLVDIALRALSPGINDPATAADVVRHLAGCLRAAYFAGEPRRVFHAESGARLFAPHAPSVDDFITDAIAPIRRASVDQPFVLEAIADALAGLDDELSADGHVLAGLGRQLELAKDQLAMAEAADTPPSVEA